MFLLKINEDGPARRIGEYATPFHLMAAAAKLGVPGLDVRATSGSFTTPDGGKYLWSADPHGQAFTCDHEYLGVPEDPTATEVNGLTIAYRIRGDLLEITPAGRTAGLYGWMITDHEHPHLKMIEESRVPHFVYDSHVTYLVIGDGFPGRTGFSCHILLTVRPGAGCWRIMYANGNYSYTGWGLMREEMEEAILKQVGNPS